jgi:uncharacterized protein
MFLLDDVIVYSASDLAKAASCEFATLRALDARLGRAERISASDPMLERAAELGDLHEHKVLDLYRADFGEGVVEISDQHSYDEPTLISKREETLAVLRGGADVVFQGSFFDGRFHGRSDFLVRRGEAYAVYDTKLARHAKISALLQLAAYADQLERGGITVHPQVGLILGDGEESLHDVRDLLPVYRERRERLQTILDEHQGEPGPVAWNDPRYTACGRCADCAAEVAGHRDLLLVAGMRVSQRKELREVGIETIEDLAVFTGSVEGMPASTLMRLRAQARMQVAQDQRPILTNGQPEVWAEVFARPALEALPLPDKGDIFFDFEGDPLWAENGSPDWGLEYLFGVVEGDSEVFVSFWAHDRAEEKQALIDFLGYVAARRSAYPGMHIYHYASYEKTALLRLAGRHGVGEEQIDDLLRHGVLVDLYSTVKQSILVSQPSYSIKKLEPLYMGDELRAGEVKDAAASVVEYAHACALRDAGKDTDYAAVLESIGDYNHYDCLSTLRLRDWLRARAIAEGITWSAPTSSSAETSDDDAEAEPDLLEGDLLELAGDAPRGERTADEQAFAMLGAALGYHRREAKPFWWAHFDRLTQPVDEWAGTRDVFFVDTVDVDEDWSRTGRQKLWRRTLRLTGEWGTGSTAGTGEVHVAYDAPVPIGLAVPAGAVRGTLGGDIEELDVDEHGRDVVVVVEKRPADVDPFDDAPLAITPGPPPRTTSLEAALRHLGESVRENGFEPQPGLDVLRRVLPRTTGALPVVGDGENATIEAITAAVIAIESSYLAVQGPPGTGKTHVGARVVKALVERGWRIGVVAQSHAVVDHFLDAVVKAGLPGDRVGKKTKSPDPQLWRVLPEDKYDVFLDEHEADGCVIGGTAWDFTNLNRVERGILDLVVIDEAGQFSLANTLAVSTAATRLMLLGDPQQLPQVSQGSHPEPVDHSALGWLMDGEPTLPSELGYFLERTWRMHPSLTRRVSRLAYDDRLVSQETVTGARRLDGLEPGLHVVRVDHAGNSVLSVEEAHEVVEQVRRLLGSTWLDPQEKRGERPLEEGDVLVVAAYNAQVVAIRGELADEGLSDVRVGTVDKFQGQEAPVVIVSMAASSSEDVPRGMEFLLSRNRVNVAVSRGKWAAIVIRSPRLTDYLPATPEGLADLGAFIGLTTKGSL